MPCASSCDQHSWTTNGKWIESRMATVQVAVADSEDRPRMQRKSVITQEMDVVIQ